MSEEKNAFCGTLSEASVIQKDADRSNIVYLSFQEGIKGKIIFLEESIFRYDVSTDGAFPEYARSEEHTSELQSRFDLVCRLLLEKKKKAKIKVSDTTKIRK